MSSKSTDRARTACTNDDVSVRTKRSCNEILRAHEQRSDLLLQTRTRVRTSQDVMTSISSAKEEDEHLEMDIDLSISSQCSEKEDEHIEKMDTMISARLPENEHVIIGTTGSADSDDGVSQPSCSEEDEDSDNGSDSEADCFSTISLEDDAVHGEEEVKLSSEIVRMKLCPGRGVSQDRVEEVERVSTFDSYVKPECNIWDQRCIDIIRYILRMKESLVPTTLTTCGRNSRPGKPSCCHE